MFALNKNRPHIQIIKLVRTVGFKNILACMCNDYGIFLYIFAVYITEFLFEHEPRNHWERVYNVFTHKLACWL